MISTFGKDIISAYTGGVPVKSIFTYGVQVWPVSATYYIRWEPSDAGFYFSINGITYNASDYNGYFSDFDGVITTLAFVSNSRITSIETNAYEIQEQAFELCRNLQHISIPNVVSLSSFTFAHCGLVDLYMPVTEYIGNGAFGGCTSLQSVSIPVCKYIGIGAFDGCAFSEITLEASEVVSLSKQVGQVYYDPFFGTPINSIYVPTSLVEAYKSSPYWSYYSDIIYPINP